MVITVKAQKRACTGLVARKNRRFQGGFRVGAFLTLSLSLALLVASTWLLKQPPGRLTIIYDTLGTSCFLFYCVAWLLGTVWALCSAMGGDKGDEQE